MKINTLLRPLFCSLALILSTNVLAQSKADKLYNEATQLEAKAPKFPKTKAIQKYKEAKVAYKGNATRQKDCDIAIARCSKKVPIPPIPDPTPKEGLSVSKSTIDFDGEKGGTANISVTTKPSSLEWEFNVENLDNGEESFIKVTRSSDAKSLDIQAEPNLTTLQREQVITVTYKTHKAKVKVKQSGLPVHLEVSPNIVSLKPKGGSKTVRLTTNSDCVVAENSNQTWYIKSKPKWVTVETTKISGIMGFGKNLINKVVKGQETGVDIKITVSPLLKSDKEYETGRNGEIIFQAQDQQYKVAVIQQK